MTADPTHTTTKTSANCGPPSLLLSTTLWPCNILQIKINPVSMHLYIYHTALSKHLVVFSKQKYCCNRSCQYKSCYYSFKIFPQLWLAKSTCIIHHNQLLMTKFGRILCLTRKWRQKCSPLQVKAPLPRRPGDEVELFWLWKKKWPTFHSLQEQELQLELGEMIAKNTAKTARRQLRGWHLLFGE